MRHHLSGFKRRTWKTALNAWGLCWTFSRNSWATFAICSTSTTSIGACRLLNHIVTFNRDKNYLAFKKTWEISLPKAYNSDSIWCCFLELDTSLRPNYLLCTLLSAGMYLQLRHIRVLGNHGRHDLIKELQIQKMFPSPKFQQFYRQIQVKEWMQHQNGTF